jgi:hypothetical protein
MVFTLSYDFDTVLFKAVTSIDKIIVHVELRKAFPENFPSHSLNNGVSLLPSDSLSFTDSTTSSVFTVISIESQMNNQFSGSIVISLNHSMFCGV